MKNVFSHVTKVGLAIVVTAGITGVLSPQSAQAGILAGSQIDFVGRAEAEASFVDFQELIQGISITDQAVFALSSSGSFAPVTSGFFSRVGYIEDTSVPSSPTANWLTFGLYTVDSSDDVTFNLTSILADVSGGRYNLTGLFQDGTAGIGQITTQIIGSGTTSFSGTLTAVPTPALLPGLAGMAVSVWRKRKRAETPAAIAA
jgi:hypothetical protein